MQVHLVDGTFELFRAFYGNPSRRDAHGDEVNAAHDVDLVAALRAVIDEPELARRRMDRGAFRVLEAVRERLA